MVNILEMSDEESDAFIKEKIREEIEDQMSGLDFGRKYAPLELVAPCLWEGSPGRRQIIERFIAELVAEEKIDFVRCDPWFPWVMYKRIKRYSS